MHQTDLQDVNDQESRHAWAHRFRAAAEVANPELLPERESNARSGAEAEEPKDRPIQKVAQVTLAAGYSSFATISSLARFYRAAPFPAHQALQCPPVAINARNTVSKPDNYCCGARLVLRLAVPESTRQLCRNANTDSNPSKLGAFNFGDIGSGESGRSSARNGRARRKQVCRPARTFSPVRCRTSLRAASGQTEVRRLRIAKR